MLEQVETTGVIHLQGRREREAQGCGRKARATDTEVTGADQAKGDASPDVSTHGRVGAVPLQGQLRGQALKEGFGLPAQEPISGGDKGYEIAAIVSTRTGVLVLFGNFAGAESCLRRPGAVGGTV